MAKYISDKSEFFKVVDTSTNKIISVGVLTECNELNTIYQVSFITKEEYFQLLGESKQVTKEYKPMTYDQEGGETLAI